jgi:hypothetical protein
MTKVVAFVFDTNAGVNPTRVGRAQHARRFGLSVLPPLGNYCEPCRKDTISGGT